MDKVRVWVTHHSDAVLFPHRYPLPPCPCVWITFTLPCSHWLSLASGTFFGQWNVNEFDACPKWEEAVSSVVQPCPLWGQHTTEGSCPFSSTPEIGHMWSRAEPTNHHRLRVSLQPLWNVSKKMNICPLSHWEFGIVCCCSKADPYRLEHKSDWL